MDMEINALILSLRVAIWALVVMIPVGLPLAWLLAKREFPGKVLLDTLITLPLVLPPVVTGVVVLLLLGRRGPVGSFLLEHFGIEIIFTWRAAVIAAAAIAFPIFVKSLRTALEGVDVRLEEAAASLGAPPLRVFFTVTLPLAWRGLLAGGVLGFAKSLGEFGATILVAGNIPGRTQTIPTGIFSAVQTNDMPAAWRLVALATVLGFLLVAGSERLTRRRTSRS